MEAIRYAFSRSFDSRPTLPITRLHKPAGISLNRLSERIPNIGFGSTSIGDTDHRQQYAHTLSTRNIRCNLIWKSRARNIRSEQRFWENKFGNTRNGDETMSRTAFSFLACKFCRCAKITPNQKAPMSSHCFRTILLGTAISCLLLSGCTTLTTSVSRKYEVVAYKPKSPNA